LVHVKMFALLTWTNIAIAIAIYILLKLWWESINPMSIRRKLALATWEASTQPNMFGKLTVNVEPALAFCEEISKKTGVKVNLNHLIGKVAGLTLEKIPNLNSRILFDKFLPMENIAVSYLVAIDSEDANSKKYDLGKVKIEKIDKKSLVDIARELQEKCHLLRGGKDKDFNKNKATIKLFPVFLIRWLVEISGWLSSSLGVSIPFLGLSAFPFGSCIITSIAKFGIEEGFIPPTPFCRVPFYICVGSVTKKPAVVDDKVVVQQQLTITATIDHRYIDGAQGGKAVEIFKQYLENPKQYFKLE
jgi:hypothetical protein